MERTYAASTRLVKTILVLVLTLPGVSQGQGLPAFAPLNPIASSRSGLSFQPLHEPAPGRWRSELSLDYASVIEYNQLPPANYVLDSEILRLSLGLSRDLSPHTFLAFSASAAGAYAGFLDGFLDWYHGALGIRMTEREKRPQDRFLYSITLPDGRTVARPSSNLFLGDLGVAFGVRLRSNLQTVLSVTLPTSTGPQGYGRGVPSVGVLTTVRSHIDPRLVYEGSLGVGLTPTHGTMSDLQRTAMMAVSSGLRYRVWGSQSLYGNLFYHSPYYHGTGLPSLDRRELSLDFGWILQTRGGGEWRVGLTEDLEPGGPGIDLVLRVGRTL